MDIERTTKAIHFEEAALTDEDLYFKMKVIGSFIEMVDLEHGMFVLSDSRTHQHNEWHHILGESVEHLGQRKTHHKLLGGPAQRFPFGGGHLALGSRRWNP